ncbi:unnamed protein product [Acanthosepion pharaonis]|uniref:Uncharacterized protein n=1 Tax=Acanthosepion pharaonis TaxID=158019 RepID=A0A812CAM3_ACAPH|nr:unnamed protein product [Sepia pharaonis]
MKIAGWNVRTLRDEGTQSLTVRTLYKYGVCVACLSEVRLPDSGHRIIKVPEVAIALSPASRASLLAWEPVSHAGEPVYAPTLKAGHGPYRKGAVINATVISAVWTGTDTECSGGGQGHLRLVTFAVANRLVVTSSCKRRHLVPSTDLIRVSGRLLISEGADTGSSWMDHTLVRDRLRDGGSTKILKRINVANLKLRAGEQFGLELRNRSLLQPSSEPLPEIEWQALKSATVEAAHAHRGVTRHRYRDWITGESLRLVEKAPLTGAANFCDLRRRATSAIRADRNAHWRAFAEETERPAACGDSRKLYQMVRRASRGTTGVSETLRSRDGAIITGLGERLNRLKENLTSY